MVIITPLPLEDSDPVRAYAARSTPSHQRDNHSSQSYAAQRPQRSGALLLLLLLPLPEPPRGLLP